MADLKRSEPGERLRCPMLVVDLDHRSYGDGKDCVVLTLGNATGRIPSAPFWSERRTMVAGLNPQPGCTGRGVLASIGRSIAAESRILQHFIASHRGRLEFGAAVPPMTLEAEVLHYADNASAKTTSMTHSLEDTDNFHGNEPLSARGIWQLDRRKAYRGRSDWGMQESGSRKMRTAA